VTTPPRRPHPARVLGEIALTVGALAGLAITGITVTAARTGLQPFVVRSGSMEPTIATGSMILAKRVDGRDVEVGDIVAVERPDHTRVTHRVIGLVPRGEVVDLTLKGDANEDPDPVPVSVNHAYRLVAHVPALGRAMGWLATAQGGFVMGCLGTAFVGRVLRGARRRAPADGPATTRVGPGALVAGHA
jgi:signal peptidase I